MRSRRRGWRPRPSVRVRRLASNHGAIVAAVGADDNRTASEPAGPLKRDDKRGNLGGVLPALDDLPSLDDEMQRALGLLIRNQVKLDVRSWTHADHVIHRWEAGHEQEARAALERLKKARLVEAAGELYGVTAAGLLASAEYREKVVELLGVLLRFILQRLDAEKESFHTFDSDDLLGFDPRFKNDDELHLVRLAIEFFDLGGCTMQGYPLATRRCFWTTASGLVDLRGKPRWERLYEWKRARDERIALARSREIAAAVQANALSNFLGGGARGAEVFVTKNETKYETNFHGGQFGAVAVGEKAKAVGSVWTGAEPVTVAQFREEVKAARKALPDDEIEAPLAEVLNQILLRLAKLDIAQGEARVVATHAKDAIDDLWVEQMLPKLKNGSLTESGAVEFAKAVLSSPVLATVFQAVLTGGAG